MLLLVFAPQPPAASPELINFEQLLGNLYPALNATGPTDLAHWTSTELYAWFDEASQKLARTTGVFVLRDTSITLDATIGSYTLPAAQVSTIQVDVDGKVLRASTVAELEALDASWDSKVGPPSPIRFVQDTQGVVKIAVYPAPGSADNGATLGIVLHALPPVINASYPFLAAPSALQDYFGFSVIGEARAKESKGAMPEVAQWCRQVCGLYEKVIEQLWGEAQ